MNDYFCQVMNNRVRKNQDEIKEIIDKIRNYKDTDDGVVSFLTQFFYVRVSGYMEIYFQEIFVDYMNRRGESNEIRSYITNDLSRYGNNLKYHNLINLIKKFSVSWYNQFENDIDEEFKNACTTITNERNAIAHGNQVVMSPKDVGTLYKKVKLGFETLYNIVNLQESKNH